MFSSLTVLVGFTVVFVTTGGWALYRLVARGFGTDPDADQVTELAHLLMSLAMLAMVWGLMGGPDSASGIAQLVVFGLFSLWFLTGALRGSLTNGLHLVSTAAMVWMVVAMPRLMGSADGSDGGSDRGLASMPGMPGMAGMAQAPSDTHAGTHVVITVVTLLVAGLLAAAAGVWAQQAVTGAAAVPVVPDEPETGGPETGRTAVHVAGRVAARRRVTAPIDAACHALMNLGMGVVLVAML